MSNRSVEGEESTQQLVAAESRKEYDQIQRELKEIDVLIQQSTGEVEKLARRNAQSTNQLRHIQSNLDTVPREDIQEAYDGVLDAQQRLFTMRGQLEKLQSDQRNMERYMALLKRYLEVIETQVPASGGGGVRARSAEQNTIVRVVEAQEGERRRLSRAMHDGPAQSMTNFILQAEICQRLFETDAVRARTELVALKGAATDTFQQIRDFIFELRPMMLDDLGLIPTVRRYVERFREKHGLAIEVSIAGKDRRLEPHLEITVFRIVQELLNNVRDHAQASQSRLAIEIDDGQVRAAVDDNGVGFNVEEVLSGSGQTHAVGLNTMYERVEMLGGRLNVESTPGEGTHVEVIVPALSE
jgi:two-component system, NarL family, sensor histidine kinase DegS